MYDILKLNGMLVPELTAVAATLGLTKYENLAKKDLIYRILDQQAINEARNSVANRQERPERNEKNTRPENNGRGARNAPNTKRPDIKNTLEQVPLVTDVPNDRDRPIVKMQQPKPIEPIEPIAALPADTSPELSWF